jgi:hypothetical protein
MEKQVKLDMSKEKSTNFIGNGSTFIKYICFLIAGRIIMLSVAQGIDLPIDQYTLAELLGYILGFIGATIDAKYHNNINWQYFKKFFNNIDEVEEDHQEEIFDNDAPIERDDYEI